MNIPTFCLVMCDKIRIFTFVKQRCMCTNTFIYVCDVYLYISNHLMCDVCQNSVMCDMYRWSVCIDSFFGSVCTVMYTCTVNFKYVPFCTDNGTSLQHRLTSLKRLSS